MEVSEEDVFEIYFDEIEKYADLIYDEKIANFLFYQNYEDDKSGRLQVYITFNMYEEFYFYWWSSNLDKLKEPKLSEIVSDMNEYNFKEYKTENNIKDILKIFIDILKEYKVEKIRVWCPELISEMKPAK